MSDTEITPTVLRAAGKDGPQRIRAGHKRFTPEAQAVFLDSLSASCNVSWSATQAGISTVTAYNHRRANPDFARYWDESLGHGYVRLETELLGTAIEYAARLRSEEDLPLKHMSVREAIALLGRHGGHGGGPTARGGRFRTRLRSRRGARIDPRQAGSDRGRPPRRSGVLCHGASACGFCLRRCFATDPSSG